MYRHHHAHLLIVIIRQRKTCNVLEVEDTLETTQILLQANYTRRPIVQMLAKICAIKELTFHIFNDGKLPWRKNSKKVFCFIIV